MNQANSLLDVKKKLAESDILYKGEASVDGIVKWKKFANSLSLRLLTRISAKNGEINVHERIRKIVNDPVNYPVFTSNADNAALDISGIAPFLPLLPVHRILRQQEQQVNFLSILCWTITIPESLLS